MNLEVRNVTCVAFSKHFVTAVYIKIGCQSKHVFAIAQAFSHVKEKCQCLVW